MAGPLTHLVVGERVFRTIPYFNPQPAVYSAFLAGCVLVDLHVFGDIDRRLTHFVGRMEEDGEDAFQKSCQNFLQQLESLLKVPWEDMPLADRAFVAGYLCHLAADESWKKYGWRLFQKLGIHSWEDFPVPGEVNLAAFDYLSRGLLCETCKVEYLLEHIQFYDVFQHVSSDLFERQWYLIRDYLFSDGSAEQYVQMVERTGCSDAAVKSLRRQLDESWDASIFFIKGMGGVEQVIFDAVDHSFRVLPELWIKEVSR